MCLIVALLRFSMLASIDVGRAGASRARHSEATVAQTPALEDASPFILVASTMSSLAPGSLMTTGSIAAPFRFDAESAGLTDRLASSLGVGHQADLERDAAERQKKIRMMQEVTAAYARSESSRA